MNRKDFYKKVAKDTQSSKRSSKAWSNVVLDCLADALATEKIVSIRNLGTFEHIERKAKVGRNAKTGERIDIPARTVVKFTPSQKVADAVAGIPSTVTESEDTAYEEE